MSSTLPQQPTRTHPDVPLSERERGRMLRAMTDQPPATPEALEALLQRIKAAPDDLSLVMQLAVMARSLGESKIELAALTMVMMKVPPVPELMLRHAQLYRELNEPEEALDDLDALLTLDPDDAGGLELRAELREEAGNLAGAADDYDRLVHLAPREPSLRWHRAEVRLQLGRIAEALEDFDMLVLLEPDAVNLRRRAEVYGENGRYAEAEDDLARAFAVDPDPMRVEVGWLQLTTSAMKAHAIGAAEHAATRALSLAPSATLLFVRSQILQLMGRIEEAEADRAAAAAIDPDDLADLQARDAKAGGEALDETWLREMGMTQAALEALGHARELADRDRDPKAWLEALQSVAMPGFAGHIFRGRAARNAGDLALAEQELDQALTLKPDNAIAAIEYATVALYLGDDAMHDDDEARAEPFYQRGLALMRPVPEARLRPDDHKLIISLLARTGDHEGAEARATALIASDPSDAGAWLLRGGIRRLAERADQWDDITQAAALGSEKAAQVLQQRAAKTLD